MDKTLRLCAIGLIILLLAGFQIGNFAGILSGAPTAVTGNTFSLVQQVVSTSTLTCASASTTCTLNSGNTTPAFSGCGTGNLLVVALEVHNVGTTLTHISNVTGCGSVTTITSMTGSVSAGSLAVGDVIKQNITAAQGTILQINAGTLILGNLSGTANCCTNFWVDQTTSGHWTATSIPSDPCSGFNGGSIDCAYVPITTNGSSVVVTRDTTDTTPVWKISLTVVSYTPGPIIFQDSEGMSDASSLNHPGVNLTISGPAAIFQFIVGGPGEPGAASPFDSCSVENDHFGTACYLNAVTGTAPNPLWGPSSIAGAAYLSGLAIQ